MGSVTLRAENLTDSHPHLAAARPDFAKSMAEIQNLGGPWSCDSCNRGSLVIYRCSRCGSDLAGD